MPEWQFEGKKLIPYRVVWELIEGKPWPDGLIALHSCDNRKCCNTKHYSPGTIAENNADKELRGQAGGLSHRDVRIIRFLISLSIARSGIADLMEVSVSTVNGIAQGRTHVRTEDAKQERTLSISSNSTESETDGDGQQNKIQQQSYKEEESIDTSI
jgi:hypothetical protein